MKFVAVRHVSRMSHRMCCVDRPCPYHLTGVGWEQLSLHIEAPRSPFKLAYYRLTLSTPKRCYMDLWLARLVLTHHYHHRLHQLPSATLPGDSWWAAFFPNSVRFESCCPALSLSRFSVRVALVLFGPLAPHLATSENCYLIGVAVGRSN